jgi:hypothetical protein
MRDDETMPSATETTELGFHVDVIEAEEKAGRWPDLTRLEARRPDILGAIVWFLARNVPVRSICRALKPMSPCTVNAVRNHPKWKKAVVSESANVVDMLDETLRLTVEDALDKAREGKMPTIFEAKLLFEMRQLLSGGATQRVEVLVTSEEEDAVRFFQSARQQTPPGMVLDAEVLPAVGEASAVLATSVPLNAFTHSGDSESPV